MPQPSAHRFEPEENAAEAPARGAPEATASGPPPAADPLLRFDPERIIRGIVFHVVDEELGREVDAESARRAVGRLKRAGCKPALRRSAWRAMTHHDRLDWLLAVSQTLPLVREDDVVLLSFREKI